MSSAEKTTAPDRDAALARALPSAAGVARFCRECGKTEGEPCSFLPCPRDGLPLSPLFTDRIISAIAAGQELNRRSALASCAQAGAAGDRPGPTPAGGLPDPRVVGLEFAADIADHWHQRFLTLRSEAYVGNLTRRRNLTERAEGAKQVLDDIRDELKRLSAAGMGDAGREPSDPQERWAGWPDKPTSPARVADDLAYRSEIDAALADRHGSSLVEAPARSTAHPPWGFTETEVIERRDEPGTFAAESGGSDGECYVTTFYGPDSKARAEDYAVWRNTPARSTAADGLRDFLRSVTKLCDSVIGNAYLGGHDEGELAHAVKDEAGDLEAALDAAPSADRGEAGDGWRDITVRPEIGQKADLWCYNTYGVKHGTVAERGWRVTDCEFATRWSKNGHWVTGRLVMGRWEPDRTDEGSVIAVAWRPIPSPPTPRQELTP